MKVYNSYDINALLDSVSLEDIKSPFDETIIVYQNYSLRNAITLKLVENHKAIANVHYMTFGGKFFQHIAQDFGIKGNINADTTIDVFKQLATDEFKQKFSEISDYYEKDGEYSFVKHYQLAAELSQLFDNYEVYCSEMTNSWLDGKSFCKEQPSKDLEAWQMYLYRQKGSSQRNEFMKSLQNIKAQDSKIKHIHFFANSVLSEQQIKIIKSIANSYNVSIYNYLPINEESKYSAILGLNQYKQEFGVTPQFLPSKEPKTETQTLFAGFKNKMNGQEENSIQKEEISSVQLHSNYSEYREIEGLYDYIVELLEIPLKNGEAGKYEYKPEDIVVVSPQIEKYESYINAVFSNGIKKGKLNYAINGLPITFTDKIQQFLLHFLQLKKESITINDILELTGLKAVRDKYLLSDRQAIKEILQAVNFRFGFEGNLEQETHYFAWEQAKEQLLYGVVARDMNLEIAGFDDLNMFPYVCAESTEQRNLVLSLVTFVDTLFKKLEGLEQSKSIEDWTEMLKEIVFDFFEDDEDHSKQYERFVELCDDIKEYSNEKVSANDVRFLIENKQNSSLKYTSEDFGKILFSDIKSVSKRPYKIVCFIGMNEGDFPRKDSQSQIDIMQVESIGNPRSTEAFDTLAFYERLMCTSDFVYFSYIGRQITTNKKLNSSSLVRNVIDECSEIQQIQTIQHPKESFSKKYYSEDFPQLKTYRNNAKAEFKLEFSEKTDVKKTRVSLTELLRFFNAPAKAYLKEKLKVNTFDSYKSVEQNECIEIQSRLESWAVENAMMQGKETQELKRKGIIPLSEMGEREFETTGKKLSDLKKAILNKIEGHTEKHYDFFSANINGIQIYEENLKVLEKDNDILICAYSLKNKKEDLGKDLIQFYITTAFYKTVLTKKNIQSCFIYVDGKGNCCEEKFTIKDSELYLKHLLKCYLSDFPIPFSPQESYAVFLDESVYDAKFKIKKEFGKGITPYNEYLRLFLQEDEIKEEANKIFTKDNVIGYAKEIFNYEKGE